MCKQTAHQRRAHHAALSQKEGKMVRYILGFRWGSGDARTLATTADSVEAAHEERTRHTDSSTMSGYPELYYDDGSGWKTATGYDYADLCVKYEGRMKIQNLEAIWNEEFRRWAK